MRFLILTLLCLNLISCGPRTVDNPGSEAKAYTQEEFEKESFARLASFETLHQGITLKGEKDNTKIGKYNFTAELPKQFETEEVRKKYQDAIQAEIQAIDDYFVKYDGSFRILYKDGDIKLLTLTDFMIARLTTLRNTWVRTLAETDDIEVAKIEAKKDIKVSNTESEQ